MRKPEEDSGYLHVLLGVSLTQRGVILARLADQWVLRTQPSPLLNAGVTVCKVVIRFYVFKGIRAEVPLPAYKWCYWAIAPDEFTWILNISSKQEFKSEQGKLSLCPLILPHHHLTLIASLPDAACSGCCGMITMQVVQYDHHNFCFLYYKMSSTLLNYKPSALSSGTPKLLHLIRDAAFIFPKMLSAM